MKFKVEVKHLSDFIPKAVTLTVEDKGLYKLLTQLATFPEDVLAQNLGVEEAKEAKRLFLELARSVQ